MSYNILGINPGHNGSSALLVDGEVVYYVEEERLTRQKYDGNPFKSMTDIMSKWHVDELVIGGTAHEKSLPVLPWNNEDPYSSLVRKFYPNVKVTHMGHEHHMGHAACAFYNSGFEKSLVFVVDGAGSYVRKEINSLRHTKNESLEEFREIVDMTEIESVWLYEYGKLPTQIYKFYGGNRGTFFRGDSFEYDPVCGLTKSYEGVTEYLGFYAIEAGKTMGLASYGKQDDRIPQLLIRGHGNRDVFTPRYNAGADVNYDYYPDLQQARKDNVDAWHRDPSKVTDIQKNIAYHIQQETQAAFAHLIEVFVQHTGIKNVSIAGGYGLNCVANYYFKKRLPNINLYCEPVAHDGGTSIGVAKQIWHTKMIQDGTPDMRILPQTSIYYGPKYELSEIQDGVNKYTDKFEISNVDYDDVAKLISERNIVTLFQGRSEAGPRALGNRTIMYDPTDSNGKDYVNLVKGREWFRPFAGSCLKEDANEWFDMAGLEESPFMMYAVNVAADKIKKIPCITHVDDTCRIQTVTREQNEHYYNVISSFKKITGVPMVFNTSFNLAGEPLVETIDDAIRTILNSKMQYLWLPELSLLLKKKELDE